jgi:hypothetical protein
VYEAIKVSVKAVNKKSVAAAGTVLSAGSLTYVVVRSYKNSKAYKKGKNAP